MKEILADLGVWQARGDTIAIATVINTWGSSPRAPGAKMAVNQKGEMIGSVSGGCVEGAVVEEALQVIKTGRSKLLHFGVADEDAWQVGLASWPRLIGNTVLVCGVASLTSLLVALPLSFLLFRTNIPGRRPLTLGLLLLACLPPFASASAVLAVVGIRDKCWVRKHDQRSYLEVDAAIVMDHLVLAAHDQGLGTCWIAMFHDDAAREVLQLSDDMDPIAFTPLGYPADVPGPKRRRPLKDLVIDLRE